MVIFSGRENRGCQTELTAGDKLSAYRVDPSEAPKGAVVVVQEVFGINPQIRKMTDQFAAEGYVAIAPALFDRVKPASNSATTKLPSTRAGDQAADREATALADIQAAVDAVGSAGKVAIVGYCWGGYLAYRAANRLTGLSCAIGYYGAGIEQLFREKSRIP
ncbi:MAG: dienelactone hydrolase family protein, partial [Alphaproteobacteria bacterium]|nr:dienelactone hydrolase family protein [Alphaproteobacteria bacterium]